MKLSKRRRERERLINERKRARSIYDNYKDRPDHPAARQMLHRIDKLTQRIRKLG